MLSIDLYKPFRNGRQCCTILIGNNWGRLYYILKNRSPPGQEKFGGGILRLQLAAAEIFDQFCKAKAAALIHQPGTLRKGIQCTVVIKKPAQPAFKVNELHTFEP